MSVQLMQLTGLAHGFPIQDLVFGTSLKKSLQRQNLGLCQRLWDKIGTFLGPFFMNIWYYIGRTGLIKYLKLYLMLYQTTLMASEDLIY